MSIDESLKFVLHSLAKGKEMEDASLGLIDGLEGTNKHTTDNILDGQSRLGSASHDHLNC
jgi:hypothetical protein